MNETMIDFDKESAIEIDELDEGVNYQEIADIEALLAVPEPEEMSPEAITDKLLYDLTRKDIRKAALQLRPYQVRYLVDFYYAMQDYRIQADGQVRAAEKDGEPNALQVFLSKRNRWSEETIKRALDIYTSHHPVGIWMKAQYGIGPVITAGFLAHIDIDRSPTAGNIWSFAGLNPLSIWLGKEGASALVKEHWIEDDPTTTLLRVANGANRKVENIYRMIENETDRCAKMGKTWTLTKESLTAIMARRPWNAKLKVLQFKTSSSFVKFYKRPECKYGHIYAARKEREIEINASGAYAPLAEEILKKKRIGKGTIAYSHYARGSLPPGHIQMRAQRYSAKIFLSHLQTVWWFAEKGVLPPAPYAMVYAGHAHYIWPAHCDLVPGLEEALTKQYGRG